MATTYLRRVDPISLGKVMGIAYGFLGLIGGAIISLLALVGAGFGAAMSQAEGGNGFPPFVGMIFGVGAIILCPLLYGFFGFLAGLIGGFFWNLALRWAGGLQIELG